MMEHSDLAIFVFALLGMLAMSAVVAGLASSRGRSWEGWFFISLLLSPLLGLILVLALGETPDARMERIREEEKLRASVRRWERMKSAED